MCYITGTLPRLNREARSSLRHAVRDGPDPVQQATSASRSSSFALIPKENVRTLRWIKRAGPASSSR